MKKIYLKEKFWPGIVIDQNRKVRLSTYAAIMCRTYDKGTIDSLIAALEYENENRESKTEVLVRGFHE